MSVKVLVIPWVGSPERPHVVELGEGDLDHLREMQAIVGGMIEVVRLDDSVYGRADLFMNEEYQWAESCWTLVLDGEGKPTGERRPKLNPVATYMCLGMANIGGPGICGDCFVTGWPDDEGNTTDVPEETVRLVNRIVGP